MTVSSSTSRADYNGNGVTLDFAVPYRFLSNTDLLVLRTLAGVSTTLTLDSIGADGFTVTGAGQPSGGTLTVVTAPAVGETLSILRQMSLTQLTDYIPNDPFPAESHERALDKLTMIVQEQNEKITRTIILPPGLPGVSANLPAPEADFLIGWNPTATGLRNVNPIGAGDLTLRTDLDTNSANAGSDLVTFHDTLAVNYVKTLTDIKNGETVSILRFVNPLQISAIKARTSVYNATTDIQAAFDSAARALDFHDGLFRIGTGLTLTGKTDFSLIADGAVLYIDNAITGLTITAMDGFKLHGELNFTGLNTATGFNISGIQNSQFAGFRAKGLAVGGILGAPTNKTYGGVSVPDQTRLHGFTAIGCGVGFRVDGEYYELVSPQIMGCSSYGLHARGGNLSVTGGVINGNRIGVYVQGGVIGNSDHGRLCGVTMNHNLAANLYIKDTDYSFHVTGCDLWAAIGDGTANGQLTEAGRTTSFGVYLQNCDNISLNSNKIARNRVNVGIDGLATSDLSHNNYISDAARTTSHLKEYGANHSTYGLNAQNIYGPNSFDGALLGGSSIRYELLTSSLTQANRLGCSVGTTGSNMSKADGTVSGAYDFVGDNQSLYLTSDTPATVTVSSALSNQTFGVLFDSVSAGTKAVTFTGALGITTQTAGVTVAGNVVTFKNDGLYIFSPTADLRWVISCAGGNEAVLTPAFTGTWANLAGGFETVGYWKDINGDVVLRGAMNVLGVSNTSAFTLPAGYRPAAKVAMPIGCDAGKSGFVVVNIDGTVVPTYEAASSFVSLSGLRFRPA